MDDRLQILIVDGNSTSIHLLNDVLSRIDGVDAPDTAKTIKMAQVKLRQKPVDILLLNIDMPGQDSLGFLQDTKTSYPHVEIIALGEPAAHDAKRGVKALEMGALEYITKLCADAGENAVRDFRLRLITLMGLVRNRKNVRAAQSDTPIEIPDANMPRHVAGLSQPDQTREAGSSVLHRLRAIEKKCMLSGQIDVVAIAASTGGPNALLQIISQLPSTLNVPILLVQHMPPSLTGSLAASFNTKSSLLVREAVDGEPVLPNVVYLAPGGRHMLVHTENSAVDSNGQPHIGLTDDPPENSVRPAADVLFRSITRVYSGNILAVVMTGMGNDGKQGVAAMKEKKCYCLTQSEETCVVYGMPRAVDEAGLSDEKVPLDQLARRIVEIVKGTQVTGDL